MAAPGVYSFPVLSGLKYDVKAFRDANGDGWPNNGDPWAHHAHDPIEVNASRNDFIVPLVDRDSDEDGFLDLHEEQAGTNPYDANSTPGLDFGLVAHWTFDETNGSVLHLHITHIFRCRRRPIFKIIGCSVASTFKHHSI